MKVFVSYAFTGEDEAALTERLHNVKNILDQLGVDYYINIYDPAYQSLVDADATPDAYLAEAFKELKLSNTVLVVNTSDRRSEGMLMEIGAAKILGKKIILAQHQTSVGKSYLPTIADQSFVWQTEDELVSKLRAVLVAK